MEISTDVSIVKSEVLQGLQGVGDVVRRSSTMPEVLASLSDFLSCARADVLTTALWIKNITKYRDSFINHD